MHSEQQWSITVTDGGRVVEHVVTDDYATVAAKLTDFEIYYTPDYQIIVAQCIHYSAGQVGTMRIRSQPRLRCARPGSGRSTLRPTCRTW